MSRPNDAGAFGGFFDVTEVPFREVMWASRRRHARRSGHHLARRRVAADLVLCLPVARPPRLHQKHPAQQRPQVRRAISTFLTRGIHGKLLYFDDVLPAGHESVAHFSPAGRGQVLMKWPA